MEYQQLMGAIQLGFEWAGVLALIIGTIAALGRNLPSIVAGSAKARSYAALRAGIGRAILLGLEFLVAADIIRSVAVDPTFASIGVLGLIILVRTFLSWSLELEITGAWPWTPRRGAKAQGEI